MPICQLFPQPLYISTLERALTEEELQAITQYKKKSSKNASNMTSDDSYVLENKTLKNLKKDLYTKVMDYFDKIVCTDNSIIPYITQSWINYTEVDQFHHRHSHSNSYVSGVFYVDAKKEVDQITFYKPNKREIQLPVSKYNDFNSDAYSFYAQTGDIVLFPSTLHHGVDNKKGTNTRISLAFNIFFKGKIGYEKQLTELTLK